MKKNLQNLAFTLIELLVVIAIIGILAAVVMASLSDSREQARVAAAQTQMKSIHTAMEMMYNTTGLYPHKSQRYCPPTVGTGNEIDLSSAAAGLVATDGTYSNWGGPYIQDVTDPWGTPYYFDGDYYCTSGAVGCEGVSSSDPDYAVIVSCGPDKLTGQDLSNGTPDNSPACAYNDDNVVYVLCKN